MTQPVILFAPELYLLLTLLCAFVLELAKTDERPDLLNATVLLGVASALVSSLFPVSDLSGFPAASEILFRDPASQVWRTASLTLCFLQVCLVSRASVSRRRHFREFSLAIVSTLLLTLFVSSHQLALSVALFFLIGLLLQRLVFTTESSAAGMEASLRLLIDFSVWSLCLFGAVVVFAMYTKLPSLDVTTFVGSRASRRALLFFLTLPALGALSVIPLLSWTEYVTERIAYLWSPFLWITIRILAFGWISRVIGTFRRAHGEAFADALGVWSNFLGVVIVLNTVVSAIQVFRAKRLKSLLSALALSQVSFFLLGWVLLDDQALGLMMAEVVLEIFILFGITFAVLNFMTDDEGDDALSRLRGLFYSHPRSSIFFTVFVLSWIGLPAVGALNGKFFLAIEAWKEGHTILGGALVLGMFANGYSVCRLFVSMLTQPAVSANVAATLGSREKDDLTTRVLQFALVVPILFGTIFYERIFQVSMQSVQLIFR